MDNFISFQDTSVNENPPLTDTRFILNISGVDTYWDGANWVSSDLTYAQSNNAVDVNANLDDLDLSGGKDIKLKIILHSQDGSQTPCDDQTTLIYSLATPPDSVSVCSVNVSSLDVFGKPVNNMRIEVIPEDGQVLSRSVVLNSGVAFTNWTDRDWETFTEQSQTESGGVASE